MHLENVSLSDIKKCPECGKYKFNSEFYVNNSKQSGLSTYCKSCVKEKGRKRHLLKLFKMTEKDYDAMLLEQGNRCALCKRNSPGGRYAWNIDHNHETGIVRGLLCLRCNLILGYVENGWQIPTMDQVKIYLTE